MHLNAHQKNNKQRLLILTLVVNDYRGHNVSASKESEWTRICVHRKVCQQLMGTMNLSMQDHHSLVSFVRLPHVCRFRKSFFVQWVIKAVHWTSCRSDHTGHHSVQVTHQRALPRCPMKREWTPAPVLVRSSQSRRNDGWPEYGGVSVREVHSVKPAFGNMAKNGISLALNTCEYSSWTIVFFPCNFRFSWFTWLSTSIPNTNPHIQSKPCNSSALPAFLGNITASPLNFHARWSPFFILSQRTLAVVEPSGPGQIHGFYHRFGDTIQLHQWIYTGILGGKCSVGKSILSWYRHLWPGSLSFAKARRSFRWGLRSQPRLVLLIDSKARNSSRISHWSLIPGINISSWAVLWYLCSDTEHRKKKCKVSCSLQQFIRQVFINHFPTPGNGPTRQTDIFKLNFIVRSEEATSRNITVSQKLTLREPPAVFG